jgi:hypothetical protein
MKGDGTLVIQAESGSEAYALQKWQKDRGGRSGRMEFELEHFELEEAWNKLMKDMRPATKDFLDWKEERGKKLLEDAIPTS